MSNIFNLEGLFYRIGKKHFSSSLSCPNGKYACNADVIIASTAFTTLTTRVARSKKFKRPKFHKNLKK